MNESPELPPVSYVMPVLNEADYLESAVNHVLAQEYPAAVELVLALGPSSDGTTEIAERLAAGDERIRLVANPDRDIPAGLNRALAVAKHPVIVRVDAHSDLAPGYTARAVASLRESGAVNVGGVMSASGRGDTQRAIAHAYNSPYGLGGGTYHGDGEPQTAESAYLGVFYRDAVLAVGGYDPHIRRGEDWELNLRLRKAGHRIWFDPTLRVTYWPRASWRALAQQFFATGVWRAVITRKYPRETPWRFFVPGTLVLALLAALASVCARGVARLAGVALSRWWLLTLAVPAVYLTGVVFATVTNRNLRSLRERARFAWALLVMHLSWGTGFLIGGVRGGGDTVDRSRAERRTG